METSICSSSVTPATAARARFHAPRFLPGVQNVSASDVFGPGIAARIPLREQNDRGYKSDATFRAELELRERTGRSDVSNQQLPAPRLLDAISRPWSHLVLPADIEGFMTTISQTTETTGCTSLLELANSAMSFLLRRTAMPAAGNITSTPPAIRILEAQPDSQDEKESLWHVPGLATSAHEPNNVKNKDNPPPGDRDGRAVAPISFWLFLKHLPTPLRRRLLCTTGTLCGTAAAPYLSAQLCGEADCGHVNAGTCKGLQALVSIGNTSLFNRFLLREKATFAQDMIQVNTSHVAHYAIVVG